MNSATFPVHARSFIRHVLLDELNEAREILKHHPELIHHRNSVKETPLHWLAIESPLNALRL